MSDVCFLLSYDSEGGNGIDIPVYAHAMILAARNQ
eukprot:g40081.t1